MFHKPKKHNVFLVSLLVLIGISLFVFLVYMYINKDYSKHTVTVIDKNDTSQTLFHIKNNENAKILAKRLKAADYIENSLYFWWYLRSNNFIPQIQAGTHYLSKSYNYSNLAKELTKARPYEINVVIPEGYTITQIDHKLTELNLISAGNFLSDLEIFNISKYEFLDEQNTEGYLFPDTYRVFGDNFETKNLISKMLRNFKQKIDLVYDSDKSKRSLKDIIIMASIIEKETNDKESRAIVSGILWKRLDMGMKLGADATTRYAVNKISAPLTYEDLQNESPYNTRKFKGLPPGPICNPGLDTITAAINPENSDYLYYLHDSEGKIHYAKTNDEHNANKEKYL